MEYVLGYIALSLFIGAVTTLYHAFWSEREELIRLIKDRKKLPDLYLLDSVIKGDVQREEYEGRTVYYRKTKQGEKDLQIAEKLEEFAKKSELSVLISFLAGSIVLSAIHWPQDLARLVRKFWNWFDD